MKVKLKVHQFDGFYRSLSINGISLGGMLVWFLFFTTSSVFAFEQERFPLFRLPESYRVEYSLGQSETMPRSKVIVKAPKFFHVSTDTLSKRQGQFVMNNIELLGHDQILYKADSFDGTNKSGAFVTGRVDIRKHLDDEWFRHTADLFPVFGYVSVGQFCLDLPQIASDEIGLQRFQGDGIEIQIYFTDQGIPTRMEKIGVETKTVYDQLEYDSRVTHSFPLGFRVRVLKIPSGEVLHSEFFRLKNFTENLDGEKAEFYSPVPDGTKVEMDDTNVPCIYVKGRFEPLVPEQMNELYQFQARSMRISRPVLAMLVPLVCLAGWMLIRIFSKK